MQLNNFERRLLSKYFVLVVQELSLLPHQFVLYNQSVHWTHICRGMHIKEVKQPPKKQILPIFYQKEKRI